MPTKCCQSTIKAFSVCCWSSTILTLSKDDLRTFRSIFLFEALPYSSNHLPASSNFSNELQRVRDRDEHTRCHGILEGESCARSLDEFHLRILDAELFEKTRSNPA
jgi:hypothetical protein